MADDSIDIVILDIDMGYLVTLSGRPRLSPARAHQHRQRGVQGLGL